MDKRIERGQIYNIYPTRLADDYMRGVRIGVVVSRTDANVDSDCVEVVFLTTAHGDDLPTHVRITSTELIYIAHAERITTVEKERLGKLLGEVTATELLAIERAMAISLGLERTEEAIPVTLETPFGKMAANIPMAVARNISQILSSYVINDEDAQAARQDGKGKNTTPIYWKGFLMIRCEECGDIKMFCARRNTSFSICSKCGHRTDYGFLRKVLVRHCDTYAYRTNIMEDEKIEVPCLRCQARVPVIFPSANQADEDSKYDGNDSDE